MDLKSFSYLIQIQLLGRSMFRIVYCCRYQNLGSLKSHLLLPNIKQINLVMWLLTSTVQLISWLQASGSTAVVHLSRSIGTAQWDITSNSHFLFCLQKIQDLILRLYKFTECQNIQVAQFGYFLHELLTPKSHCISLNVHNNSVAKKVQQEN